MGVSAHANCRVCGGSLIPYLDLGTQAPPNALVSVPDLGRPEFQAPLSVAWCGTCGLSQLEQVVDPQLLYANYPFRAGASELWKTHCVELVNSAIRPGRGFWLDIGSNDGVLLEEVLRRNWKVLGVDPCDVGSAKIPTLCGMWDSDTAKRITRMHGQIDVISATNVFGHVDTAGDFLEGIALSLKPHGLAVIECPHVMPMLESCAFDTIYHEHLSYWSLVPLELLAEKAGLRVTDVRLFSDLHGGTMRYVLRPGDSRTKIETRVTRLRIHESVLFKQGIQPYQDFAQRAAKNMADFRDILRQARREGRRIWGYGANAKGAVLLQASCIGPTTVERIVDDCEAKWGMLMPGTHIPITNADALTEPDVLVLLSWNNAPALKQKALSHGFKGRFFLPNPTPHFD